MKILLINKFHYRRGGAETYHFALAEALTALGHEVIFFSMTDERNLPCAQAPYFVPHVDYMQEQSALSKLRIGAKLIYSFGAKRRLAALLREERPDIAHCSLIHRHLTVSVLDALQEAHIPVVMTLHDLIPLCPCYTMLSQGELCERCAGGSAWPCVKRRCVKASRAKSLLAALESRFCRLHGSYDKVALYIAPSRFYAEKLQSAGFTKSPVRFLPNPLPPGSEYALCPARSGSLLYQGRLSYEKGLHTLLEALALCPPARRLLIAGEGPMRPALEALIAERGLSERVALLGYQSKPALTKLVKAAAAVVVPSEWYENAPYSVMEAMALGKPVLASEIGGLPELVEKGRTGLLFPARSPRALAEALERLYALPAGEYDALCHAALAAARERFEPLGYARVLTALYAELIESRV